MAPSNAAAPLIFITITYTRYRTHPDEAQPQGTTFTEAATPYGVEVHILRDIGSIRTAPAARPPTWATRSIPSV